MGDSNASYDTLAQEVTKLRRTVEEQRWQIEELRLSVTQLTTRLNAIDPDSDDAAAPE